MWTDERERRAKKWGREEKGKRGKKDHQSGLRSCYKHKSYNHKISRRKPWRNSLIPWVGTNFVKRPQKAITIEGKNINWTSGKLKPSVLQKTLLRKLSNSKGENICSMYLWHGFICRIHKKVLQFNK